MGTEGSGLLTRRTDLRIRVGEADALTGGAVGAQRREPVPPAWMRRTHANALW